MLMRASRFAAASLLLAEAFFTPPSLSAAAQEPRTIRPGESINVRLPVGDLQKTPVAFDLEVETSGPLTIEARSYDFDTLLKVARVGTGGGLVPVGQDDDGGFGNNSRLGFEAEGGVRYRVEVQPAEIFYCEGDLGLLVAAGKTDGPDPQTKQQGDRAYWEAVKARGEDSTRAECRVEGLRRLGAVRRGAGALGEAKPLAQEALALAEKELAPEHLLVASALDLLATVEQDLGSYTEAKPLFERALAMREKQLGPEHADVAQSLNNLAVLLLMTGSYAEARPLFERCLAITERQLGSEDPIIALLLNNLGVLLGNMGSYTEARSLAERALAIQERQLGPEHPVVAQSLGNVAYVLQKMGSYAEAKLLFERAQAIYEKQLGPEHPEIARNLNNLALLLQEMGSYTEARPLFERALAIRVKQLGADHPYVATTLGNLAMVLQALGLLHEAKQVYERAAAIYEKQPGPGHPDAAKNLSNLALLLQDMGSYTEAKRLLERALAMFEKQLDSEHPYLARAHKNLAAVLARTGSRSAALTESLRAEEIGRNHARLMARALAERQALRYASVRDSGLDLALSLVVEGRGQALGSGRRVWDAVVRSRALVLDEMASRHRAYGEAYDPVVADLSRKLASASGRLANLIVRGPGRGSPDQYLKLLDGTRREEEGIEQALAEKSLAFRQELAKGRLGLDEVVQNLPPGSALLAFALYDRHDLSREGKLRTPSYVAFVLRAGEQEPAVVPIGTAEEIDAMVSRWQEEAARGPFLGGRSPGQARVAYRNTATALRRRIWDPVGARVRNIERVFVVPDGSLNLISLASLPVGESDYLIEKGPLLHYLSAERDLVPQEARMSPNGGLLALGGPAFDDVSLFAALSQSKPEPSEPAGGPDPAASPAPLVAQASALRPFRGERSGCEDFQSIRFQPLPASAREAEEVADFWMKEGGPRQADVLIGASSSEAAFKAKAPGMGILHLSTHGFFLGGRCASALQSGRGVAGLVRVEETAPPPVTGENPLLLSGLALAGANHRFSAGPDEEDGILTAEEIAAMDLSGVEWAVLSACDTGIGEVKASEGVFGLRRAFQIAGARTLIMSLWSVEDESARQWMRALYEGRLQRRLGTAEAVREASVTLLRERRRTSQATHPFYWAGFVAAGDWR